MKFTIYQSTMPFLSSHMPQLSFLNIEVREHAILPVITVECCVVTDDWKVLHETLHKAYNIIDIYVVVYKWSTSMMTCPWAIQRGSENYCGDRFNQCHIGYYEIRMKRLEMHCPKRNVGAGWRINTSQYCHDNGRKHSKWLCERDPCGSEAWCYQKA